MDRPLQSSLLLIWTLLLLSPVAWAASLIIMFPMTGAVCDSGNRTPLLIVGAVCAAFSIAAALLAHRGLHHTSRSEEDPAQGRFLLQLALGMSALFALVTLAFIVPVYLLDPCPR